MFSTVWAPAASANRPCAFITAAPVPATVYSRICGTNIARSTRPTRRDAAAAAGSAMSMREGAHDQRAGDEQDKGERDGEHQQRAEEASGQALSTGSVAGIDPVHERRDQDGREQRPRQQLVIDDVRERVDRLVGVAEVGRAEDGADRQRLRESGEPADGRPQRSRYGVRDERVWRDPLHWYGPFGQVRRAQNAPRRPSTAGIVRSMIKRSSPNERRSTYSASSVTASRIVSIPRPLTCQSPVMPGFTVNRSG